MDWRNTKNYIASYFIYLFDCFTIDVFLGIQSSDFLLYTDVPL